MELLIDMHFYFGRHSESACHIATSRRTYRLRRVRESLSLDYAALELDKWSNRRGSTADAIDGFIFIPPSEFRLRNRHAAHPRHTQP